MAHEPGWYWVPRAQLTRPVFPGWEISNNKNISLSETGFCKAAFLKILHRRKKRLWHHCSKRKGFFVLKYTGTLTDTDPHPAAPLLRVGHPSILNISLWFWVVWGGLQ